MPPPSISAAKINLRNENLKMLLDAAVIIAAGRKRAQKLKMPLRHAAAVIATGRGKG